MARVTVAVVVVRASPTLRRSRHRLTEIAADADVAREGERSVRMTEQRADDSRIESHIEQQPARGDMAQIVGTVPALDDVRPLVQRAGKAAGEGRDASLLVLGARHSETLAGLLDRPVDPNDPVAVEVQVAGS